VIGLHETTPRLNTFMNLFFTKPRTNVEHKTIFWT